MINIVLQAQLSSEKSFDDFQQIPNSKIIHKPNMIKIRFHEITFLIFRSMKCRVMGKPGGSNLEESIAIQKKTLKEFILSIPWKICIKNVHFVRKISTLRGSSP